MASQLQTSCRASWWTIGVCILAAALFPGEPLPAGPPFPSLPASRRDCGARGCRGVRDAGSAGKDGVNFLGVRLWSRCGRLRVGESRGRF